MKRCVVVGVAFALGVIAIGGARAQTDDVRNNLPRASSGAACSPLPPMPRPPAKAKRITDFGVSPGEGKDQAAAIQRALDSLSPGDWLVFPPGRYEHGARLRVKVPNVTLWSDGATLHATNPGDMAVLLEADGTSIYNFTLTGTTDKRRSAPWESRIAVFGGAKAARLISNNTIRGNRITESGPPGSPLANSSGSAAIFVYHAQNFLVAENTVSRSLSDGIHVTAGSSYGRVLKNTVRETGDDMIAVVSYVGDATQKAAAVATDFDDRRAKGLSHHVLIADNTVSGGYWGRGISVVGGEAVTIERNTIDHTTHAAGIYLARETSYLTFGVRNVLVRNNTITDVQTTAPAYVGGSVQPDAKKTRHGAIEIYSWLFDDEQANGKLKDALAVEDIRIEDNTITRTATDGVRIGTGWGKVWSHTAKSKEGGSVVRNQTGGPVGRIALRGNKMSGVGYQPIAINNVPTGDFNIACEGNTVDGQPVVNKMCEGAAPKVEGACP